MEGGKLYQKADVKAVEDLECRIKQFDDSVKERFSNKNSVQHLEENVETGQ